MTDRELMQMALHTLEGWDNYGEWVWPESALESCKQRTDETLEALRERLAQPELEWVGLTAEDLSVWPPPKRELVGLTDEEIFELGDEHGWYDDFGRWTFNGAGLIKFALALLKAEREACAKVCETECAMNDGVTCAEEIRARGEE